MQQHQDQDSSPTAVLVNDDLTQLNVLSGLLCRDGFEVKTYSDAEMALEALEVDNPPGLIVTDIYMPGIDGWQFCRLLRSPEYEWCNRIPILVVSATFSGEEASRITVDLGANAFLPSPVDGRRFTELARTLVRREKPREFIRVLIVEDSRTLLSMLKKAFESHGYQADTALSGKEAIDLYNKTPYEVVVLDYHLPDIQGDQLLVDFRKTRSESVIIMMTTDPQPGLAVAWMKKGASAYVRKPFEMEYLIELCAKARRERALLRVEDLLEARTRELRENEAQLRNILENLNDVVYAVEPSGTVTYVSPNVETLAGYRPDEIVGKSFLDFVHPDDVHERMPLFLKALAGEAVASEYRFLTKHNEAVWVRTTARPSLKNGEVSGLQGVLVDITERKKAEEELQFHSQILSAIQDTALVISPEMKTLWSNQAAREIFGDRHEMLTEPCYRFFKHRNTICDDCPVVKAMADGQPHQAVMESFDKDGSPIWRLNRAYPFYDGQGQIAGAIEIVSDYSEQKRLLDELAESEEKYRTIFHSGSQGIFLMTDVFQDCNEQVCRILACERQDVIGSSPVAFSPPLQPDGRSSKEAARAYMVAARNGESQRFYWQHRRKDDVLIDCEITLDPLSICGQPYLLATMTDITSRMQAERALADERNLFIAGPTIVFKWRAKQGWPVVYASENVLQLLGYSAEALRVGAPSYVSLIHSDDLARVVEEVDRHTQAGDDRFEHRPYRLRCQDGGYLWVADYSTILRDSSGNATHYQGYVVDITRQRESEERLDLAIKGTQAGLWDWHVPTGKTVFNERWAEIAGYTLDELAPTSIRTWMDLCHPDELIQSNHLLEKHFNGETDFYRCEARVRHKNGAWVWVLDRGKVVERDDDGNPVRVTGTHVDITERKRFEMLLQAERDLSEAWSQAKTFEARLEVCLAKAIQMASMDCGGIYRVDESDNSLVLIAHQGLSEAFVKQVKHYPENSESSLIVRAGKPVYGLHQDLIQHKADAITQEGLQALAVIPVIIYDRVIACLNVASRTQMEMPEHARTALEKIALFAGSFIAQELVEEKERQNRQNLEALFNTIEDMVFILDMQGNIISHNPTVIDRLEFADHELIGKHVLFLHPEDRRQEAQAVLAKIMAGQSDTCPIPLQTKNGHFIPVETKVKRGRWQGQDVIFGICRDITERQEMERRKHQIEKAESISMMAGAVAHNFNNMLGAVIGNLELVMEDLPPGTDIAGNITEAKQAAHRAAQTSGLMLTFLGQTCVKPTPIDLSVACKQCLDQLIPNMPERITLETDLPAPGLVVKAGPEQIGQVLTNLATNAWEAMEGSPGKVRVTIAPVDADRVSKHNLFPVDWTPSAAEYIYLLISDTGRGMHADTIEKIFDPFFTDKFTGRGLGLAVVLGIVKSLEGCITVESHPGKGSTFRVFLPQSDEAVLSPEKAKASDQPVSSGGNTVLLVEDEEIVRKVARAMMERLGYDVLEAVDGEEAVELFREHHHRIHMVLSDLTMPRMDGWQTLAALRHIQPTIPVVLASGYDEARAMAGDHPEQPQVFLHKPYEMKALQKALESALTKTPRSSNSREPRAQDE